MDQHTSVNQLAAALHRANLTESSSVHVNSTDNFKDYYYDDDKNGVELGNVEGGARRHVDEPLNSSGQKGTSCSNYYYQHNPVYAGASSSCESYKNDYRTYNSSENCNENQKTLSGRTQDDAGDNQFHSNANSGQGSYTAAVSGDDTSLLSSVAVATSNVEENTTCSRKNPLKEPEEVTFPVDGQSNNWVSTTNNQHTSDHNSASSSNTPIHSQYHNPELWGVPSASEQAQHYPLFRQHGDTFLSSESSVPFAKYSSNPGQTTVGSEVFGCDSNTEELFMDHETTINSPYKMRNTPRAMHPADLVNIDGRANMTWSSDQNSEAGASAPTTSVSSANTTESVRVSSSFHVAEIVGKQGVKIKKIRANTNTWIKTPVRGEDPVFIVSGRREGVEQAKALILASNEKVSTLRELRSRNSDRSMQTDDEAYSFRKTSVGIHVSVPSDAVGLVIGPKGSRIRQISEATSTYIKTPCRHREPTFEIYGQPEDVELAKEQIMMLLKVKLDDEYIKQWMTQLPIHEPGSPVRPSTPILPMMPPMVEPAAYTKLRQSPAYHGPTVQTADSHMLADMYPSQLQPTTYPCSMQNAVPAPYTLYDAVSMPGMVSGMSSQPMPGSVMQLPLAEGNIPLGSPPMPSGYLSGF